MRQTTGLAYLLGAALVSGCLGPTPSATPHPEHDEVRRSSAIVIAGEQLWQRGGDLLGAISSRVSNMQVRRNSGCPEIALRGRKTIHTASDPRIYVDGQRAANTCVLEMVSLPDVDRVEVYPMGITQRPGYLASPYGLILVFLRRGSD